ncbi:MAG: 50S ribosomal protein L28 [Flavobacteriales bacterium]|nr:50S ribosomal protein L28 [Flavobacteriales bacterium]
MSRLCQITGKKAMTGNNVSHANNKSKRKFQPNLQTKRFFVPSEDKWVTIKISANGIRTINKIGIEVAMKRAIENGYMKA